MTIRSAWARTSTGRPTVRAATLYWLLLKHTRRVSDSAAEVAWKLSKGPRYAIKKGRSSRTRARGRATSNACHTVVPAIVGCVRFLAFSRGHARGAHDEHHLLALAGEDREHLPGLARA